MRLPSGAHSGTSRMAEPPLVTCCAGFEPSCAIRYSSSSPVLSEMNAICEPSGDQLAHLSCAPDELVRLRVGPFSIGTVKISPRAENSARSPFGLKLTDSIKFEDRKSV